MEIQWELLDTTAGLKGLLLCLTIADTLLEALSDTMRVTEKHGYCFRGEEFKRIC